MYLVVIADGAFHVAAEILAGLVRDEVGKATGCIAPEQGALRAAQDLHPLHVIELEAGAGHLADIDLVEVQRDRALDVGGEVAARHTADRNRVVGLAVGLDGGYTGRHRGNLLGIGETELLHLLAAEGAHRDTDILHALLALLRGHGDFIEYLCLQQAGQQSHGNGAGKELWFER